MAYIEPVKIDIKSENENVSPRINNDNTVVPDWPTTHSWTFDKIMSNDYTYIEAEKIRNEFRNLLRSKYPNLYRVDEEIGKQATRKLEIGLQRGPENDLILTKENQILYCSSTNGLMFILSENKSEIESTIQSFKGKMNNFRSVAEDFGLNTNLLTGREFAEYMSGRLDSEVESRDDFDNEFESMVYEDIVSEVTGAVDANVTLKFGDEDPEVFEYDMIIHLSPTKRIMLEVKDGSHPNANLGKNKIIDTPRDKTNIIQSEDTGSIPRFQQTGQTEACVVIRDMDADKLEQHRQKAERRDINLLSYSSGDFVSEIESMFKDLAIQEI